ncbi:glycerophosphoryl diester phosphodiesterase membrane domain-containing protein [Arthrobacter mobilis]|uniref:DUF7847 domain-containing protein n=1 Tax=Arthrobacter mobilis TaxID=2724944 RepID=A0A7X6HBB0_9MICC|nr:glycerophosphoryl diester phosphodiesterase membrane domain-containing protein [Arthrobacter mobilis]NKX53821.1 hypothetical protein [Arthrobacter mobilis]
MSQGPAGSGQPPWGQQPQWGQPPQWGQQPQWGQVPGWQQPPGSSPGPGGQPGHPGYPGYPGYTAPPKPGVIPLRPLGVGEILDGAFQAARKNAAAVFGTAVLFQVAVTLLAWLAGALLLGVLGGTQVLAGNELPEESALSLGASLLVSSAVLGLLSSVGVLLLQGVLAIPTARAAVNQRTGFALMWSLARGRTGALVVLGLLYLLLTVLVLAAIVAGAVVLADLLGAASALIIVLVAVGLVLAAVWIGIKLMLAPAAMVLERASLPGSLRRSWQLTSGNWWRTFGIVLLCTVIVSVITSVISMPISFALGLVAPLTGETASPEEMLAVMGPLTLASMLVSSIFSAIGYAFQAAVIALVYIDLRIRREGFDVILAHEHEQAAGSETRTIPGLSPGPAGPPDASGSPWAR